MLYGCEIRVKRVRRIKNAFIGIIQIEQWRKMGRDFYLGWSEAKLKKKKKKRSLIPSSMLLNTKALCCSVVLWEYYSVLQYYKM